MTREEIKAEKAKIGQRIRVARRAMYYKYDSMKISSQTMYDLNMRLEAINPRKQSIERINPILSKLESDINRAYQV
jgi:hypothetical protein